jgi:hypothetical protein
MINVIANKILQGCTENGGQQQELAAAVKKM